MSNSRNRRRTLGAFGKVKPRVIKHVHVNKPEGAPPAGERIALGANVVDALVDFARPITEQAGNNHTAIHGAMNVAILIWNAIIEGEAQIEVARQKLLKLPGATTTQIDELIQSMVARKAELYPDIKQIIRKYELEFGRRGTRIYVSSINLSPPGVEKTDIASQLGATA
ncbi:MAG: hypothetical protein LBD01_01935 [Puniceicoccales bacterium]|jgi:hypothetical protein|nr:hypothetical protein [Puniceicoccales bacterium]